MKGLLSTMKFNTYEEIIADENIMDIIGILEYNPALATRIEHRKILRKSRMLEVIPFTNPELKNLIISTHRLQYLQDILVPTPLIIEDRASYLLSIIFFRKSEIVEAVLEDKNFMGKLFENLINADKCEENHSEKSSSDPGLKNISSPNISAIESDKNKIPPLEDLQYASTDILKNCVNKTDLDSKSDINTIDQDTTQSNTDSTAKNCINTHVSDHIKPSEESLSENTQKTCEGINKKKIINDELAKNITAFNPDSKKNSSESSSNLWHTTSSEKSSDLENSYSDQILKSDICKIKTTEARVEFIFKFISELCSMSRIMQIDNKRLYFSRLLSFGIVTAFNKYKNISSAISGHIVDILFRISEVFGDKLREEVFAGNRKDGSFFKFICDQVHKSPASNISQMAVQIILLMFDTQSNLNGPQESFSEFFGIIYNDMIDYLFKPLMDYTFKLPLEEKSYSKALVVESLLGILGSCFGGHGVHIENYLMRDGFLLNINNLLMSKYNYLVHGCIKIIRQSLGIVDKNFRNFLLKEKVLDNFLDSLLNKHKSYTLINSALIELFEYLKISGNKPLAADLVERRKSDMEKITYVPTFRKLVTFGEQFNKIKASKLKSSFLVRANELFKNINRSALSEDERENHWFSCDDAEENRIKQDIDDSDINLPPVKAKFDNNDENITLRPVVLRNMMKFSLKRPCEKVENESMSTNTVENSTTKSSLVDYSDDDDQEESQTSAVPLKIEDEIITEPPSTKKSKLV